jgi:predicted alpha-1,2-mannosidase
MKGWTYPVFLAILACRGSGGTAPDALIDPGPGDPGPADVPSEDAPVPDSMADPGPDLPDGVTGPDVVPPDPDGPPYTRHVNPFAGTGGALFNVGSALPGATAPFGLVKASPDTTTEYGAATFQHCAGYRYEDGFLWGISHNHLHGTGAPDYGNLLFFPAAAMTVDLTSKERYRLPFTHEGEVAEPGWYSVTIADPHVKVDVAASTRCAHHRYDFLDAPASGSIVFTASAALGSGRSKGGELALDPAQGTIEGWNHVNGEFSGRYGGFKLFYTIRFDRLPAGHGIFLDDALQKGETHAVVTKEGTRYGAWMDFATGQDRTVEVQVCLSYVSVDGAKASRDAEMPGWDLEGERAATLAAWEKELSRIEVKGGTPEQNRIFYTALYHVMQMPTIWSDRDGSYQGFDKAVHMAEGWTYYTDMSFWDTFRTLHPLLNLIDPVRSRDMLRSVQAMQEQGGYTPQWPMGSGDTGSMIGEHAASFVADAVLKGVDDFDVETVYAHLRETASGPLPPGSYGGRECIEDYLAKGYCPADRTDGSVSITQEHAFVDRCLANLATHLGKGDDATLFAARASNYKNVWDPSVGFFRGRLSDGTFVPDFTPELWDTDGEFVEGTAWQWLWFAPQDEAGLRGLFGSDTVFVQRLSEFFERAKDGFDFVLPTAWYYHGNEPDLHSPWLFIRAGRPDLAQKWARWVLDANYRDAYDGIVGNDDGGTLAAWYVFASLGLFPWPCFPGYYLSTPIFDTATLHLPGGDLSISAPSAGTGKMYVKQVRLDGKPIQEWWLEHSAIVGGGKLEFVLSDVP